eukprot:11971233-Karenia_brevis.AAC.1
MEKIKPRMEYDKDGSRKVRTVRRIDPNKRWSIDSLSWVVWAPWRRYRDAEDADGDVPEGVRDEDRKKVEVSRQPQERGDRQRVVYIQTKNKVPRSFKISRGDIDSHGPTT